MRTSSNVPGSRFRAPLGAAVVTIVAAAGCFGGGLSEPATPEPAVQRANAMTPTRPAGATVAPTATAAARIPAPAQVAATPEATRVPNATSIVATATPRPAPRPTVPGVELHDSQVVRSVRWRSWRLAPWYAHSYNVLFSSHVFGTPFILDEEGQALPWIATGISPNEDMTVWTMKLREDAVFQDGTPITAADFKAFWEFGAIADSNSIAWGAGHIQTLHEIRGWDALRAGDAVEADGLRVVDNLTLEIETVVPTPSWPLRLAAWYVGISKPGQLRAEADWYRAPIGAGPYSLTYDPDSGLTELTRADLVGKFWNGPHDTPIIEKLVLTHFPDQQTRLIMFENGELDLIRIDAAAYEAMLDPDHSYNPLLYDSPLGGLWFIRLQTDMAPLEDPLVRKALAHGQDMAAIVKSIWGRSERHARGLLSSRLPCHDPNSLPQPYDPDLARQELAMSSYEDGSKLPPLLIELHRPDMFTMSVAIKEFWKDNLDVHLEVLELGAVRRSDPQLLRRSLGSWTPDPVDLIRQLRSPPDYLGLRRFSASESFDDTSLDALFEYARSLPPDHSDRCGAFRAVEQEYLDLTYMIPIKEAQGRRWLVQPWLRGFKSTFNQLQHPHHRLRRQALGLRKSHRFGNSKDLGRGRPHSTARRPSQLPQAALCVRGENSGSRPRPHGESRLAGAGRSPSPQPSPVKGPSRERELRASLPAHKRRLLTLNYSLSHYPLLPLI